MKPFLRAEKVPQTIGVLICTFRRPGDVLLCLDAIEKQTRLPDDVVVIVRDIDEETRAALAARPTSPLPVRVVTVYTPGVVAARNMALTAIKTDIVVYVDDDTIPLPGFIARVFEDFINDPTLGGLGGKDRCFFKGEWDDRQADVVGKIQWFGRVIGNHHIGYGPMREVDVLKGCNMSFRTEAIGDTKFDTMLRGTGSGNEDMSFTIAIKNKGWKCVYDPEALLEHYPGKHKDARPYGLVRRTDAVPFRHFAYNEVVGVWYALSPLRRTVFVLWSFLIGTGVCPGLLQALRYTREFGYDSWRRFAIAQQGKFMALRDLFLHPSS
jgi:GT2 family glycosyltransferase